MTILHLEDSTTDAVIVETLLQEEWADCRVRRVASRAEFESALEFEEFDLIISDHQLPGFDGLQALEQARTQRPDKPFVFMSGTIGEERAIDAMKRGADDYVIKDRPARLVPAVRQALTRVQEAAGRRRVEEALRQNQERFRQIAENVADMIAVLDLDGRRVYNNPAYRLVLGEPDQLRGTSSFEDIHPEDRERVRGVFAETVRTGIGQRLEYRFLLHDGSIRYIESQGSVIRRADGVVANVLVVSRDVTARRAAELQLRDQASLLDKARDAIVTTDLEHRISYWNASAERIYGWSAAEVLGRNWGELGVDVDARRFSAAHQQLLATGEWHGQFQRRARKGARVDVASTWTLVLDAAGEPRTVLHIDTDITEAKQMETQLLRAQRAESIGTLTGGIAHDLNNVLAPILMAADLLRTEPLSESGQRIVQTIEESAQHGAALVRQLLGFARGSEGEREPVWPARLLDEVVGLLHQTLSPRVRVELAITAKSRPVLADTTQLKQLLLNLCLNARDAMPNGGSITIEAEDVIITETQARTMPEGCQGPHLHLRVSDTGTGIPPEILDRIFDPFFTTKDVGKGTGLGLSMVRGIVKGHQGFLHVESTVGAGTTFHIFLPLLDELPSPGPKSAPARGAGEAILIIDDDASVREMLAPFLRRHGYRVLAAVDAQAGPETLRRHALDIAAIVMGLARRDSGVAEAIADLERFVSRVPIVICAGSTTVDGAAKPIKPIYATISKPVDPMALLQALRNVLDAAASPGMANLESNTGEPMSEENHT